MTDESIGSRIDRKLKERGEKRSDLARGADLNYNLMRNIWRRPETSPRSDYLQAIADYLGTSTAWLLEGGPEPDLRTTLDEQFLRELATLTDGEVLSLLAGIRAKRALLRDDTD